METTVKIGGAAGQGIQTVGQLLALACQRGGLFLMGIDDHESRVRGGHNFYQLRLSTREVKAPVRDVQLLVALDKATCREHGPELVQDGLVIAGEEAAPPEGLPLVKLELMALAEQAGGRITANTVAAGACLSLLGAPFELLAGILKDQFKAKGDKAVEMNLEAAGLGFKAVEKIDFAYALPWTGDTSRKRRLVNGAQALAWGALSADLRFASFYPMSPATGVMTNLSHLQDRFPLHVEQVEDEISAVNMAIGASHAGVRSITSTSGGGFSLMTEGLGLAAITETPLVIINAQRPGPATGLPTRTAQADLLYSIWASQDEFPRFVMAPGTPAQAYRSVARALDLAEKYQVPAIVLSDQYLMDSMWITTDDFPVADTVGRYIETDPDPKTYQRYALTESGVSPRALPGRGQTLFWVSGNEHQTDGHISEKKDIRTAMMNKRMAKLERMLAEMEPPQVGHPEAETFLVGWGSTWAALAEAVEILRDRGEKVGHVHFCDLWPFPAQALTDVLGKDKEFLTAELNFRGQLATLIRQETGLKAKTSITRYDGRPFCPMDIVDGFEEHLK